MRYTAFKIRNFRGISDITIDLDALPNGNVFPVVGLNESGKTTVLEAISLFSPDVALAAVRGTETAQDRHSYIPRHKIGNFTDQVEIAARVSFDESDAEAITRAAKDKGVTVDNSYAREFWIAITTYFENSLHTKTETSWRMGLRYKKRGKKQGELVKGDDWVSIIAEVRRSLPRIQYFPTFLFAIPDKIVLNSLSADKQSKFYAELFADIIRSTDPDYDINNQVIDKIQNFQPDLTFPEFFLAYWSSNERRQIEHVFLNVSRHLTDVVFGSWSQIFGTSVKNKEIVVTCQLESSSNNKRSINLEIKIKDGSSIYDVRDRSTGFRWFFCFLLFTRFRSARKDNDGVLFLFDEPASNLHPRAQQQLLETFGRIASRKTNIIYSTHSHYLINPKWLEATLLVRNNSLRQVSPGEEINFSPPLNTDITAIPYKRSVGENPDEITYYQPILDAVSYAPSKLDLVKNAVFVEGKSDFYLLSYFAKKLSWTKATFIPGSGSGHLDELISLYLGWGVSFLVLLDDDDAGRKEKARYIEEFYLSNNIVLTLGDVFSECLQKHIESVISDDDKNNISKHIGSSKRLTKKQFAFFFQECAAGAIDWSFSESTLATIKGIFKGLSNYFEEKKR